MALAAKLRSFEDADDQDYVLTEDAQVIRDHKAIEQCYDL